MRQDRIKSKVFFYTTSPLTCPYIEGQVERRMVTELSGIDADELHNVLSKSGFRRSHYMAYIPVCSDCSACIPVRIVAENFKFTKSRRRLENNFSHLESKRLPPIATQEHFQLFETYQHARHNDGDMAAMDFFDFRSMVEETPVPSSVIEFRDDDKLVGALLCDHLNDGLSAVYSYFSPETTYKGMGNFMILWAVRHVLEKQLPFVYLGYLIEDCRKMSYKARFSPLEGCFEGVWSPLDKT